MITNKVRSAVLEKNQKVVVKNLFLEDLLPLECEVKIKAAGICSSDISRGYGGTAYHYPLVMGHELAGEITRVGIDAQDSFNVGDQVCVLCKNYDYYGSRRNGGFAEKLNVNQWNLLKIPDGLDIEDCALVEPTAVALHAIEKLNLKFEEESQICIIGAGFIGLMAVQIINLFYPKCDVVIIDRNQYKLNIGSKYGAITQLVDSSKSWKVFLLENLNKFDYVIELVGSPKTFSASLDIASQKAYVVWAGNISGDLTLNKVQVSSILRKELNILGTWNSIFKGEKYCDWKKTLNLISKGLKPSELVTSRINLEEIDRTLGRLYSHKNGEKKFNVIKVLVNPDA